MAIVIDQQPQQRQRWSNQQRGWAFLFFTSLQTAAKVAAAATTTTRNYCHSQRFVRIIDGGSTGSRLHTFEYLPNDRIATVGTSTHVDTPLSDYVHSGSAQVRDHLLPLFDDHGDNNLQLLLSPENQKQRIPVYYGATAGMRLVKDLHLQTALYDRVSHSLNDHDKFSRHNAMVDVFTLSGTDEAYYGALAANYLATQQQQEQQSSPVTSNRRPRRLLGALDIGGASTQLVSPLSDDNITKENFFATSLLGYGVDQFQKRLFSTTPPATTTTTTNHTDGTITTTTTTNNNPCLNVGYVATAQGNSTACAEWMRPLLADVPDRIATEISTNRDYWAMSLFFFSFDALRHFSADAALQAAWPTPSLTQLQQAGETLCRMTWEELQQQQSSHVFTRNNADLAKRCFEAVYLVELLTAMKFTNDHRIHYMFQTERGDEVEWTLGMAIALREAITQECLDNDDGVGLDDEKEEGVVNRTENHNDTRNVTWARLLSSVLSADDIFSR